MGTSIGGAVLMGNGRRCDFGVGVGARLGYANLRGEPSSASFAATHHDGLWGGVMVTMLGSLRLNSYLRAGVAGEAGITTLPLTGTLDTGKSVFSLNGIWLGASLTLGVLFGRSA